MFDKKIINNYVLKVKVLLAGVIILFIVIIFKLYNLQVIQGDYYAQKAENNFIDIIRVNPNRGNIYDRNGNLLAKNLAVFNLYAVPKFINEESVEFLLQNIKLSDKQKEKLNGIITAKVKPKENILIKEKLDSKELSLIESRLFRLSGIDIIPEPFRYYPENGIPSHIVGYINKINQSELASKKNDSYIGEDYIGRMGIEKYLEKYLRGKPSKKIIVRDKNGAIKNNNEFKTLIDSKNDDIPIPEEGNDVYLTLDLELQKEIDEIFYNIRSGSAVVIDVDTGDVLAIYSKPTFNPNMIISGDDKDYIKDIFNDELQPTLNKVFKQYYPGSVFKVITALAALDLGTVKEEEKADCEGFETYGNTIFRCWKRDGHGKVNFKRALSESCDVYFYKIAKEIGLDEINNYGHKMGIGSVFTDFIPDIPSGFVPNSDWYKSIYGRYQKGFALNTAIGQGDVYLSPFKIAEIYGIIANLGIRKQINFVDKIVSKEGKSIYERKIVHKIVDISPAVFQKVHKGLFSAVNSPSGTAYYQRIINPLVSGKTGTAQVASKTYDAYGSEIPWELRHHAWFAGFAPSYKPEIVVAVLIDHGGSSSVAVPIAMDIIKAYEKLKDKRNQTFFQNQKLNFETKSEELQNQ